MRTFNLLPYPIDLMLTTDPDEFDQACTDLGVVCDEGYASGFGWTLTTSYPDNTSRGVEVVLVNLEAHRGLDGRDVLDTCVRAAFRAAHEIRELLGDGAAPIDVHLVSWLMIEILDVVNDSPEGPFQFPGSAPAGLRSVPARKSACDGCTCVESDCA